MTPKTKFEKRVVKLKDSLPSDPPKGMKEWIYDKFIKIPGYTVNGKTCYCGNCGELFSPPKEVKKDIEDYLCASKGKCDFCFADPCSMKQDGNTKSCLLINMKLSKNSFDIKCPNCHKSISLNITNERIRRYSEEGCALVTFHGIQLIRNFQFNFVFKKKHPVEINVKPTCTRWISNKGEIATTRPKLIEKNLDENGYKIHSLVGNRILLAQMYHNWRRRRKPLYFPGLNNKNIFPVIAITPYLKLRGFKKLDSFELSKWNYHGLEFFGQLASLQDFIGGIIKFSFIETLIKEGEFDILDVFLSNDRRTILRILPSFYIMRRHKYHILNKEWYKNHLNLIMKENLRLWIDMVDLLYKAGKDIRNPKYICPEDLQKGHEEAQFLWEEKEARDEMLRREEWERNRPRDIWWFFDNNPEERSKCVGNDEYLYSLAQQYGGLEPGWHVWLEDISDDATGEIITVERIGNDYGLGIPIRYNSKDQNYKDFEERKKLFTKIKQPFFNLEFGDDELRLKSMDSWEEYYREGKAMHNCVESNGYWTKKDSLILSVKKNNLRVADVEISLKTFKILQCWGPCNQPTPYRDKIEGLIQKNIHLIKERMK